MKVWLYRLQQRLAITRSEAAALLVLTALLLTGLGVRYVQDAPRAAPAYAETDHRFRQAAARLKAAQAPPATSEEEAPPAASDTAASDTVRMNLNRASAKQLERLPRVGPVISKRIAAYRKEHGPFAAVAHLQRVSGIGPKTMERLAPLLFVAPPEESLTAAESQDTGEQAP